MNSSQISEGISYLNLISTGEHQWAYESDISVSSNKYLFSDKFYLSSGTANTINGVLKNKHINYSSPLFGDFALNLDLANQTNSLVFTCNTLSICID